MSSPGSSSQSSSLFELALEGVDALFWGGAGSLACSSARGSFAELDCSPPASAPGPSREPPPSRVSPLGASSLAAGESPPPCCSEGPCPKRSFSSGVVLFSSVFIRVSRAALI
jgi:hypothetical protein